VEIYNLTNAGGQSSVAIGDTANASLAGNVAIGQNATTTGARSVAIGSGSTDSGQAGVFAVGATAVGTQRKVVNVAPGAIAAGSTDATNGGQFFTFQTSIDTRFASMGIVGPFASNAIAVGVGSNAAANAGVGSFAGGYNSRAAASNSVALGSSSSVTPTGINSAAIGSGSVASQPNTVSFGSPGNERRLTNIAPGVLTTDAAMIGQLNAVHNDERRARGCVAMALAAATVNVPLEPGEMGVVGGVGYFRGETSLNLKCQARPGTNWVLGASVGVNTREGDVGAAAGFGYKW
jgi:autotransporter adhesin